MRLALVTAFAAKDLDQDLAPLLVAAQERGWNTQVCCWDDASVDWSRFDVALLRSTWDYAYRLEEFLAWVSAVARQTELQNSAALVLWNTDKRYLLQLADLGVPIIATRLLAPGSPIDVSDRAEFVVKPSVGAGARGVRRFASGELEAAREHILMLHRTGKTALVQPYLGRVEREGETALIYFNGVFSHAIRKGPLLPVGARSENALFEAEAVIARTPRAQELAVGQQVLAAIPAGAPLYARIDLLSDAAGRPLLLELEVTEPSLFLATEPGSAQRLLHALATRRAKASAS